jgi:hypothetical protein|tara:strand:- start:446 stop:682 length:237 start_codon:yes stop_codon:yes gene_type:complete
MDSILKPVRATAKQGIVGQKIANIHLEESEYLDTPTVVIELDNGVLIFAQRDDEFNDSGIMVALKSNDTEVFLNYEGS